MQNFKTDSLTITQTGSFGISLLKDFLMIFAGGVLIALSAQVVIPFWPVPFSGQTFAVLLTGSLLGSRKGALSVISYISGGLMGLPVFAAGGFGILKLVGPTAGYIYGFIAAAFIVGWLIEHGWKQNYFTVAAALLIGNLVIYTFGLSWLSNFVNLNSLFTVGFFPFILGDLIKIVLAASSLQAINYFSKK